MNTENWIDFQEQYILAVAKLNTDVETLVVTGKEPKWIRPNENDMRPVINDVTGQQVVDAKGDPAFFKVYKNNEEGKEDYKFDTNVMRKRIQAYKEAIKPCIVLLVQNIDDSVKRVMKIDETKYKTAYENNDLVTLLSLARFASTGQGADSIYGDLVKMSMIKVEGGDWIKFTYVFQELRKRILNSNIMKEDIIEKFFDALFIIRSGEGIIALEKLVGEIMCLKNWPTADTCIATWNTMLTTKKNLDTKFDSERKEGALSANMSNLQEQVKNLQQQIASYGNASTELQAHYTKAGSTSNMTCYNCGKKGHGKLKCRMPPAVCKECGENHITSQHAEVMKVLSRNAGKDTYEKKPVVTRQAHIADVTYEDDPEDTSER